MSDRFATLVRQRLEEAGEPSASFGAEFGTIAGQHTADELRDLLAAKDHDLSELDRIRGDFLPKWTERDPAAAKDWSTDYDALKSRYALAHSKATQAIAFAGRGISNPVGQAAPASLLATESAWGSVLRALKQNEGSITKGDLQDLAARLKDAGATLDMGPTVQPGKTDDDLSALNALAVTDVAGVLAGENKNPAAQKLTIALGIGIALVVVVAVASAVRK